MRLGAVAGRAGAFAHLQASEHSDECEVGRAQAPHTGGDLSLASAHVRFLRGKCGRSAAHRAVDCRSRVDRDDAALLSREHRGVEERGGGDTDAVAGRFARNTKARGLADRLRR